MNDRIGNELKQAVARKQVELDQPELETVLVRAAQRQRRRRLVSVVGACLGVAVAAGVVWIAVAPAEREREEQVNPSSPSAKQEVVTFKVPTNGWRPGRARMESKVYGTLRFTDEGCPFLEAPGSKRFWVAFPADATGVKSESGTRLVTDPDGHVYGTEGELVNGAGGPVDTEAVKDACHSGSESTYSGFMDKPTDKVVNPTP